MGLGSITNCNAIFTTIINTISLNRSTCRLAFANDCLVPECLHTTIETDFPATQCVYKSTSGFEPGHPLVSMSFLMPSMESISSALWKTIDKKHTNMMMVADSEQTHSTYSTNSTATFKMYMVCRAMHNPNIKKPMNNRPLNIVYLCADWCDKLTPNNVKYRWTTSKIFIFLVRWPSNCHWIPSLTVSPSNHKWIIFFSVKKINLEINIGSLLASHICH